MTTVLEYWGNIAVVVGAMVFASAALGMIRFPDAYARISAVGTAGGIGIILIVTGVLLLQPGMANLIQTLAIIAFQLFTSAIGSISIARSAYLAGTKLQYSWDDGFQAIDEFQARHPNARVWVAVSDGTDGRDTHIVQVSEAGTSGNVTHEAVGDSAEEALAKLNQQLPGSNKSE
jgi:multicomponent Na+:H+ antiporter subunit G